jgi:hypothetical protein
MPERILLAMDASEHAARRSRRPSSWPASAAGPDPPPAGPASDPGAAGRHPGRGQGRGAGRALVRRLGCRDREPARVRAATMPRFWDRPSATTPLVAGVPGPQRPGARPAPEVSGWPSDRILEVAGTEQADMITLGWRRRLPPTGPPWSAMCWPAPRSRSSCCRTPPEAAARPRVGRRSRPRPAVGPMTARFAHGIVAVTSGTPPLENGKEAGRTMATNANRRPSSGPVYIEEPTFSKWLFGSSATAWIWLVARLWLGWEWLQAGWSKAVRRQHHLEVLELGRSRLQPDR